MNRFDNREQDVLNNVSKAISLTKEKLIPALEQSKLSINDNDNVSDISNSQTDINNSDSNQNVNSKKLVRTLGTPYNVPAPNVNKNMDLSSNYNVYNNTPSEGFSQTQSGNVSTGTLIFVFAAILTLMVFAISYCIFKYLGL